MTSLVKLKKFQAWKYRISLVLEENELDTYISGEVPIPEGDEAKARDKRIIADSIKDHLIPHVSSLKTSKGSVQCYDEAVEEE